MSFSSDGRIQDILDGLSNVADNEAQLRKNVLQVAAEQTKRVAMAFLGTGGPTIAYPGVPWAPLSAAAIKKRKRNHSSNPLLDVGDMRKGIKINMFGDYAVIKAIDWKSGIHELGTIRIPARPFLGPAILTVESDESFWKSILAYCDQNIEFMAFDRRGRATEFFYSENPSTAPVQTAIDRRDANRIKRQGKNQRKRKI